MRPIVLVFLAINTGVFVLWLILGQSAFMLENFLVSWEALAAGRTWTLLTSEFSHLWFLHFFINMYVLASFGPIVEHTIGSARFLSFYLFAAVIASLSHAAVSAFVLGQPGLPALGASGAIAGVILLFSLLYPRARILLFGFIPMPALFGALLFVGLDIAGLLWQVEGGGLPIGHGAHLGGAVTGVLYYFAAIRPLQMRHAQRLNFGDVATWRRLIDAQQQRELDDRRKRE
jgi:membrane associated rhomboid family serine protease